MDRFSKPVLGLSALLAVSSCSDDDRHDDIVAAVRAACRGTFSGQGDLDGDLIPNRCEDYLGLTSDRADSDGDLIPDGEELYVGTNPLKSDTDGDGISDGFDVDTTLLGGTRRFYVRESNADAFFELPFGRMIRREYARDFRTDLHSRIHMGDGFYLTIDYIDGFYSVSYAGTGILPILLMMPDGLYKGCFRDAHVDYDRDGLSCRIEYELGTDPYRPDSDGDGYLDGAEVDAGTNPLK